jgi:hypothetical protein
MPQPGAAQLTMTAQRRAPSRKGSGYVAAAVFLMLISVAGFGPSVIDQSKRNAIPTPLVVTHGLITAGWICLFLAQTILARSGRVLLHRRLGAIAPIATLAMVTVGFVTVIEMSRRGYDLSGDLSRIGVRPGAPAQTREELAVGMFAPLLAFANFGLLTATGLWFRHRPEIHKRVMLLAMMSLAAPPVIHLCGYVAGHWPGLHSALVPLSFSGLAVLFTGAVIDRLSSGRIHPISLWGPVLLITETFGLIAFVTASAGWHRLATWLVS